MSTWLGDFLEMKMSLSLKAKGKRKATVQAPSKEEKSRSSLIPEVRWEGKRRKVDAKELAEDRDDASEKESLDRSDRDEDDPGDALAKLQAMGQAFMSSFGLPDVTHSRPARKKSKPSKQEEKDTSEELEEESSDEIDLVMSKSSKAQAKSKPPPEAPKKSKKAEPETVVFDGERPSSHTLQTPMDRKSFMSSKTARLDSSANESTVQKGKRKANDDSDAEEDEKQNASNDRLLSQLLSTTLFAPNSTIGTERKKKDLSSSATIARIMELTTPEWKRGGRAIGRGWGEMAFKKAQNGRMPTKMQVGLDKARKEKQKWEIEREKELGIYNPHLKRGEASSGTGGKKQKRERGIGMGVGRFKDGALRLSKADIAKVQGKSRR